MLTSVSSKRQVVLNTDNVFSTMASNVKSVAEGYITLPWLMACVYQLSDSSYNGMEEHMHELLLNQLSENIEIKLLENTISFESAEQALEDGGVDISAIIDHWLPYCFEKLDPIVYGDDDIGVYGERVSTVKWLSSNIVLIETNIEDN